MGVHAAFARARQRITGEYADMFPSPMTAGRFEQVDWEQTGPEAFSAHGRPVIDSLPLTGRPDQSWVGTSYDTRWGYALQIHYEGQPLTFYEPRAVDPRTHAGYNPFIQYPPIARGNPIPYGDTVPVLGNY